MKNTARFTLALAAAPLIAVGCGDGNYDPAQPDFERRTQALGVAPLAVDQDEVPVSEDQMTTLRLTGVDPAGQALDFRIVDAPDHGTLSPQLREWTAGQLDSSNGESFVSVNYAPDDDYEGADAFTFEVRDEAGTTATGDVGLDIRAMQDAPRFVAPTPAGRVQIEADQPMEFAIAAADQDRDPLTYEVKPLPSGADFADQTFTWEPGYADVGERELLLSVTDGYYEVHRRIVLEISFTDAEGDGLPDAWEEEHGLDPASIDSDNDTISDFHETLIYVGPPTDTDGDGVSDALDMDSDDDGIPDSFEAGDTNPDTPPWDTDRDGIPDFQDIDSDDDGIEDAVDNCVYIFNTSQRDFDGDRVGDACDDETIDNPDVPESRLKRFEPIDPVTDTLQSGPTPQFDPTEWEQLRPTARDGELVLTRSASQERPSGTDPSLSGAGCSVATGDSGPAGSLLALFGLIFGARLRRR